MVDIHHHLLHGLDDGAPDLATSIAMCRMAVADGIKRVVCTPHLNHRYAYVESIVLDRVTELREALLAESISLELGLGCDFHLSYENLQDVLRRKEKYTINNKSYLLVELPDHGLPPNLDETFYELQLAGVIPVVTHPERNPILQRDLSILREWLRHGVLMQVTASSVLGKMGKSAESVAGKMLSEGWVHFLATDAHNLSTRLPIMSEAHSLVSRKFGRQYADLICIEYPNAAFEGVALDRFDLPLNLFDPKTRPSSRWRRLLGL